MTSLNDNERAHGPMRVGVSSIKAWRRVNRLVAELEPVTDTDWDLVAAIVLDEPDVLRSVA